MKLLLLFIILNVVNVILQTAKSIATMKCGKVIASIANAVAYGLYTVVIVFTNCELPLLAKVAVVAATNLIGVYIVKVIEEKLNKEKLWKVEATIPQDKISTVDKLLTEKGVPHNYLENIGKYAIVNCFCATRKESEITKQVLTFVGAKWFVSESKIL